MLDARLLLIRTRHSAMDPAAAEVPTPILDSQKSMIARPRETARA